MKRPRAKPVDRDPPEIVEFRRARAKIVAETGGTAAGFARRVREAEAKLAAMGHPFADAAPAKKRGKRSRKRAA
jgi:hypothetical protein